MGQAININPPSSGGILHERLEYTPSVNQSVINLSHTLGVRPTFVHLTNNTVATSLSDYQMGEMYDAKLSFDGLGDNPVVSGCGCGECRNLASGNKSIGGYQYADEGGNGCAYVSDTRIYLCRIISNSYFIAGVTYYLDLYYINLEG